MILVHDVFLQQLTTAYNSLQQLNRPVLDFYDSMMSSRPYLILLRAEKTHGSIKKTRGDDGGGDRYD